MGLSRPDPWPPIWEQLGHTAPLSLGHPKSKDAIKPLLHTKMSRRGMKGESQGNVLMWTHHCPGSAAHLRIAVPAITSGCS